MKASLLPRMMVGLLLFFPALERIATSAGAGQNLSAKSSARKPARPQAAALTAGSTQKGADASPADKERSWRRQFAAAGAKVASLQREIAVLDLTLNQLNSQWLAAGDTTVSLPIAEQMKKARAEREQRRAELDKAQAELDRLHRQARAAHVPPEWTKNNPPEPPDTLAGRIRQAEDRINQLQLRLNDRRNQYNLETVDSERAVIRADMERLSSEIEAAKRDWERLVSQSNTAPAKKDAAGTEPQKKRPRRF